jgi:hypothetical protein
LLLIRAPLLSGTPNLGTSIELTKLARADRVLVASHPRRKWRLNIADHRKSGAVIGLSQPRKTLGGGGAI